MKKIIFVIFISLIVLMSCSKDHSFVTYTSSDFIPEYFSSHNYTTKGRIYFAQYGTLSGGYMHGFGDLMMLNYKGLPEGELVAFWHSFKYFEDDNGKKIKYPESESYFYAYDPDVTKIKVPPKRKYHRNYAAFFSYGRYKVTKSALKRKDLTKIPYAIINKKYYQMGEIDKLYALIVSESEDKLTKSDIIYKTPPSEHYEIQAIAITPEQYDYFMEYEDNNSYLNERVPGFTEKQKKYMDSKKGYLQILKTIK